MEQQFYCYRAECGYNADLVKSSADEQGYDGPDAPMCCETIIAETVNV